MTLNEEQTLAVQHTIGPACLIAGAGSGKTRVLTERVRWLIQQGVLPKRICVITFTNKAAGELVDRLEIPAHTSRDLLPNVSTIHSLALRMIRRNPPGFGLGVTVSPLDDYDQFQMVKKIIERTRPDEDGPARLASHVLEMIAFHRARGCGFSNEYTEELHEIALKLHGGYHAMEAGDISIWRLYEQEKVKNSVVDFDDMIHYVVRRGRNDVIWREKVQRLFEHVLMDEAQDTNPIQWEFVNLLLGPDNQNIYVVGDMSQSIYGFNGAVPKILKDYSEGWRSLVPTLYRIQRNHRSVPEVVQLANAIQGRMTDTIPLKMESWRGLNGEKGTTKLVKACLPSDIAGSIASEIWHDNQLKRNPIFYKENAILVRSAIQIRDLEGALVRLRIPYVVYGGRGLLQTEEVRDILAYLRLATNPKDFMAFVRAVSAPKRGVGEVTLEKIRVRAEAKYEGDLLAAVPELSRKLALFVAIVRQVQQLKDSAVSALQEIISRTQYTAYLTEKYKKDRDKVATKLDNINRFIELVAGLVEESHLSTEDVVFQLTIEKAPEKDEAGKVTISTIHKAKGLEWKRVYVSNLFEGSLPHKFSVGSPAEIEEERRLLYVATTRARDTLVYCVPGMSQMGPNTAVLAPSRFLMEVGIQ